MDQALSLVSWLLEIPPVFFHPNYSVSPSTWLPMNITRLPLLLRSRGSNVNDPLPITCPHSLLDEPPFSVLTNKKLEIHNRDSLYCAWIYMVCFQIIFFKWTPSTACHSHYIFLFSVFLLYHLSSSIILEFLFILNILLSYQHLTQILKCFPIWPPWI